ncbi:LytTR family transcriptional regulator DNA-binding domain-containing protein [Anaerorhabdus sp.]|uniref:LytTR family transcriptional regulator DNA-binding domain-containing protein n=1 Tax=Anaerorhabdus sp. TaxID=1872524 RepID=UPI003FA5B77E
MKKIENNFIQSIHRFQTRYGYITLKNNQISAIEVINRKVELHAKNEIYILKNEKISSIHSILNDDFFQINRSTIINLHKIISIKDNQIFVKNIKKAFLLSKYRKKDFYSKYVSLTKARNY